ncbi:ulp1 protease family, C-terminal catalytic domain-containing protein [Artemisia annua]|uniref:Ulp1 protease family, C-terminal catalytic domain-containing protein n=1 Tax=Artemisia annua TaxID=35608 RepID=A0A2U1QJF7_ARTAN|nr:ulp1 protease family, C-terminal catalytic domain-containing protein [Artemisia annua]
MTKKRFRNPTRISPRTLEKNKSIEEKQSESTEPETEEEYETEAGKSQNRHLYGTFRSSPRDVVKILERLTDTQKQNVKEIGFESLLDDNFNINTTPTKLGYWVVEQFDHVTCTIKMGDGRAILITAKMIKDMMGIPMGGTAVTEVRFATTEHPLIVRWRHTYDYPDDRFTLSKVVEKLLVEHHTGLEFKLNFLVAVMSILGDCTKNGLVNQKFIQCIEKEEDIKNMDWCTYLLETMKKSKAEYTRTSGFGGPLLLMVLLYLNSTVSEEVEVDLESPAIKAWDTQKLKKREKQEINMGGFGKLPIKEGFEYVEKPKKKRMTRADIQKMKYPPEKQLEYRKEEIARQVLTPRVELGDGICGIGESSNRIEAVKKFQKKPAELLPGLASTISVVGVMFMFNINYCINNTLIHRPWKNQMFQEMKMEIKKALSITGNIQSIVDEMLEMASISYPEDEEFKSLIESRNEKIMRAFKPGKIAAALESEKDINDELINDAHISQEENDVSTDDFLGGGPDIETVMETPEEYLETNGGNKQIDESDGINERENVNGDTEKEGNEGVGVELVKQVGESPKTVENDGINEGGNGNVDKVLNEMHEGGKSADVGLSEVEKDTEDEVANEIVEDTEIRLVEESPGEESSVKNKSKNNGKSDGRTISQILVRLVNKGETTENVTIPVATETDLEGTKTVRDSKRQYIDFTPPSFNLFSQDDEMNNMDIHLNNVMNLTITQPSVMETGDKHESGVVEPKKDKLVTLFKDNFVNKKDNVTECSNLQAQKTAENPDAANQQTRDNATNQIDDVVNVQENVGKAGESIQENGEEPRSENVIVNTFLQPKTNTRETFSKRPKVTIKISGGLQKPGDLTMYKTGADKGKQVFTSDEEKLSPNGAISAVPISFMRPMEQGNEVLGKRVSNPTEVLLSPYVKRKVSITTHLQSDEKAIVDCMFSGMLPPMDIVFKTFDMEIPRVVFESMYDNLQVTSAAIDVWSIIQNNDEKLKNKVASRSIFCKTGMLLTRKADDFKRKMEGVVQYSTKKNLDNVEMVFFPITMARENYNHYYLIVYNLKTWKAYIIDNMQEQSQDIIKRYGDIPSALTKAFANYLQSVNHPNATKVATSRFKILKLEWETSKNRFGSGIFLMRHMETFCGTEKEFKSGLKKEGIAQNHHLTSLRKKYVVKMLMTLLNEKRDQVEQESKKYGSFNDAQKQNFQKAAFPKLQKRVIKYFEEHEEKLKKKWSFLRNKSITGNNMM